jgi:PST family polysaccharide transporter
MNYAKIFLQRLMGIDIIKVFSLNAMATLIRMCAGMISVKVIAVIIGPAGIALLGQLNNLNTILLGMANGGINTGITKYVAECKEDENEVKKLLSNAIRITLTCSTIVGMLLIAGCVPLSRLILMSDEYYYVFIIFGFTIILYTLNGLLISILNGYKQFKKYVIVNISGTILGLIYSVTLVTLFGLPGALINAVTFQSIVLFVTLWWCRKEPWMKKDFFLEKLNRPIVKRYLGYSAMTLTTLAVMPVSQMLLRGYVITEISPSDAGIWEGMNHISGMYLNVIVSALSIYYLPRISEITDKKELHHEVMRCYKVVLPMLLLMGFCIFILKDFILWLLFTPEFNKMKILFPWQLVGDFFKMSSWLLSFIMVAKARTKLFITTEICFTGLYLLMTFILLRINGIVGLTQGYLLNYIFYLLAMIYFFRDIVRTKEV